MDRFSRAGGGSGAQRLGASPRCGDGRHAGAAQVEVSLDGGKTWREASFIGPNLGRYAWRPFVLQAELKPGSYVFASRVTDSQGKVQVETTPDNAGGYLNSGWRAHAVTVNVA